jgi:hypothetical protein
VTQVGLAAAWYQKWQVHRRRRPEELAGRVENLKRGRASYPLHAELLGCAALPELERLHSTCLLPAAYPEGCPTHPSYPAAHAVIAGACATVLKAFFDATSSGAGESASSRRSLTPQRTKPNAKLRAAAMADLRHMEGFLASVGRRRRAPPS